MCRTRRQPFAAGPFLLPNSIQRPARAARLGTVGVNGAVRLWDLGFQEWQGVGCRLVRRNLSLTEWQRFLPGRPYQRTCAEFPSGPGAPSSAPAATYSS